MLNQWLAPMVMTSALAENEYSSGGGQTAVKVGGVGGLLFMVFHLVLGARYQLVHCPASCSSCNIHLFYFTLLCFSLSNVFYIFMFIFNNYSPKAKLILLNNPRDEVEEIVQQY